MRPDARFILDTNVIVSALAFPSSKPRQVLDAARKAGRVLASRDTLGELVRTLRRPKLAAYIAAAEREAFLEAFGATVELVEVRERLALCRDPRDDKFLELAAAGGADYLVTATPISWWWNASAAQPSSRRPLFWRRRVVRLPEPAGTIQPDRGNRRRDVDRGRPDLAAPLSGT